MYLVKHTASGVARNFSTGDPSFFKFTASISMSHKGGGTVHHLCTIYKRKS